MKLRDLFSEDLDRVFSYRTERFVIIKDMWLGCTYRCLQLAIMIYVVLIALVWNEGYIKREFSLGTTLMVKEGGELVSSQNGTGRF